MKLLLAHGASGNAESMRPWVEALAPLGVEVTLVQLPHGKAERAVPGYRAALEAYPGAAIGGHSFGGRVASLLAAEQPVSALVLLSYPLHLPGRPEELRTGHWADISCPVLMLSGDRDQFATIDILRDAVPSLSNAQLHVYSKIGHGLNPVISDASVRIAEFLESLA